MSETPMAERKTRRWWLRVPMILLMVCVAAVGALVAAEIKQSRLQAHVLAWIADDIEFTVEPGPSESVRFPEHGPYNRRLGYVALPELLERLGAQGGEVVAQARWSPRLSQLTRWGVPPVYEEKPAAGLRLVDRHGDVYFDAAQTDITWTRFEDIPLPVAETLAMIENREVLSDAPYRNPAVEWDRLALAAASGLRKLVEPSYNVPGASTLATQMEKFRHSPRGMTHSVSEKARQMSAAALRAFMHGPDSRRSRRRIVRDYLNSVPLAAVSGLGAVHGFGEGLYGWFGTELATVNELLVDGHPSPSDPRLAERGRLYRQIIALSIGLRRPGYFLGSKRGRADLERRIDRALPMVEDAGIISKPLAMAAAQARLRFAERAEPRPPKVTDRKAALGVRHELMERLGFDRLYDLDRLDVTVHTTVDAGVQKSVSAALSGLSKKEAATRAGIIGHRLLSEADLDQVLYSFVLMERTPAGNAVRINTDTHDGPFSLNDGMKLELGSTAKLRTLVTWLELTVDQFEAWRSLSRRELYQLDVNPQDPIGYWVRRWRLRNPEGDVKALVQDALDRKFSASPHERFFTGGGEHRFNNFDDSDDGRIVSVRDALRRSVNLPLVRMMREAVHHLTYADGKAREVLRNPTHPERARYLDRFAAFEGKVYLERFWERAVQSVEPDLDRLAARSHRTSDALAVIHRMLRPDATFYEFSGFVNDHAEEPVEAEELAALYDKFGPEGFNLHDRGYVAGLHPLELWVNTWRRANPEGDLAALVTESGSTLQAVYAWLTETDRTRAQNNRIKQIMEQDAFVEVHRRWKRLGFPFDELVPSYGTALGSSGDRPSALAEFAGILAADGLKAQRRQITRLVFAAGTPYETHVALRPPPAERVLPEAVATAAHDLMRDVVSGGTARRVDGLFGEMLPLGGKTGTGDNRSRRTDKWGRVISETVRNRTGTFMFTIGDRWFGAVTAYVPGESAQDFGFTSALAVQILSSMGPDLLPVFAPSGWREGPRPASTPDPGSRPGPTAAKKDEGGLG